ncbi:MAG: GNAT family N-acetyltransferase [Methanosphaera stadtmanae]|jgi:RimJ/RimL family protein N-acetyltransferase|nr:GNAT family N-acetyltransferase [Methanosphaera stadtmanae]
MNHKGTSIIKTERLILRPFKMSDVCDVYDNYGSDVNVARYISWIPCDTIEKCENFIKFNLKEYKTNPKFYSWVITLDDNIIGSVAIFNVDDDNDSGELGYSLGSKWWSNGYMTEATNAVLNYSFNEIGFNRIYASCHEENIASKKVMEKLSMTYEGLLRDGQRNLDNTYSNLLLYAILKRDYKR